MSEKDAIELRAREANLFLGARIRERRKQLKITQSELGQRLGMPFQQVQKYESGENRLAAVRLPDLARALQVPASYFFELGAFDLSASDKEIVQAQAALMRLPATPLRTSLIELIKNLAP